jgi:hypothetical protein
LVVGAFQGLDASPLVVETTGKKMMLVIGFIRPIPYSVQSAPKVVTEDQIEVLGCLEIIRFIFVEQIISCVRRDDILERFLRLEA